MYDGLNLSWQSNRTSREDPAKEYVSFLTRAHVEAQVCVIVAAACCWHSYHYHCLLPIVKHVLDFLSHHFSPLKGSLKLFVICTVCCFKQMERGTKQDEHFLWESWWGCYCRSQWSVKRQFSAGSLGKTKYRYNWYHNSSWTKASLRPSSNSSQHTSVEDNAAHQYVSLLTRSQLEVLLAVLRLHSSSMLIANYVQYLGYLCQSSSAKI